MDLDDELLKRVLKIRNDPLEFLKGVRTLDEVDREKPIKPFPWNKDYVQLYIECWMQNLWITAPKSRRMTMSWLNIALFTWDTIFHRGRRQAFVSKKEEDSDELVQRAKFIVENLDWDIIPREIIPKHDYTFCNLKFPETMSSIEGYPSGADQLRQHTFSGIFGDEMAFWPDAQEMYSGSFPTVQGSEGKPGGRFVGVSSAAPGFFKALVHDQLDYLGLGVGDGGQLLQPRKIHRPMQGVRIWKNPKNQFLVFELHYTADPAKRSEIFRDAVKSGLPIQKFLQEYEIKWDSYAGMPVFRDWNKDIHCVAHRPTPERGLPLLLGWDFGLTPACIIAQLQDEKLVILDEILGYNIGSKRFAAVVKSHIALHYTNWTDIREQTKSFVDPSGFFRKDTDEGCCADDLINAGFSDITPGAVAPSVRKEDVEHFLTRMARGEPCFQLCEETAPKLHQGFEGGYHYPENSILKANDMVPVKNEFSHPHDGLQYVAGGARGIETDIRRRRRPIPTPSYARKRA